MTRQIGDCTLYLGDCLEILPTLDRVGALVTDPVWPDNNVPEFAGIDAESLFGQMWRSCARHTKPVRAVFHLGTDTNPAMLGWVTLPFFRVVSLEYVRPHYKGRILYTGDIAYMYGTPPRSVPGKHVISGRTIATVATRDKVSHPTPRNLEHVSWYVHQFTEPSDIVLDPFMGSGTTGVACTNLGRKFVGIEIEEKYFDIACSRIEEVSKQPLLVEEQRKQPEQHKLFHQA